MMIEAYISFVWHGRGTNDTYTCEFQTLRVERVVDGGSFLFIVIKTLRCNLTVNHVLRAFPHSAVGQNPC